MLRGNQPARIDEKGRLKIPTGFRTEIENSWGGDFYITSIDGESVLLYPLPVWQEIENTLAKLPPMHPSRKRLLDRTSYYGQEASADKQGRILIPMRLRESAEMVGEVAVLGKTNFLEVWNDERCRAKIESTPLTDEDFLSLGI